MARVVLDASAVLAWLLEELGHTIVEQAVLEGADLSVVNFSEVLSRLLDLGRPLEWFEATLENRGFATAITMHAVTRETAREAASLRLVTRAGGLSLGDRMCLALARGLDERVLTTDHAWSHVDTGVEVELIR